MATPPLEITRSRTRRGARRMPLGAAMGLAVAKPGPRRALARWGSEQGWPLRGQPARGRCRRHAAHAFGRGDGNAPPRQGRGSPKETPLRFHRRSSLFPPSGFGGLGAPAFRKFGPFYFVGAGFLAERKPSGFRAQGPGRALRGWAARNGGPGGSGVSSAGPMVGEACDGQREIHAQHETRSTVSALPKRRALFCAASARQPNRRGFAMRNGRFCRPSGGPTLFATFSTLRK